MGAVNVNTLIRCDFFYRLACVLTSFRWLCLMFEIPTKRENRKTSPRKKNIFFTATKLGTTNKYFVPATTNFAAATKRFSGRTKHFVVVTKYLCYPYFNK